jgi:hypothetical protein
MNDRKEEDLPPLRTGIFAGWEWLTLRDGLQVSKGDIEGFCMIFFNNLLNISIPFTVLSVELGAEYVRKRIIPGA